MSKGQREKTQKERRAGEGVCLGADTGVLRFACIEGMPLVQVHPLPLSTHGSQPLTALLSVGPRSPRISTVSRRSPRVADCPEDFRVIQNAKRKTLKVH